MTWATIVIMDGKNTRVHCRFTTIDAASHALIDDPEIQTAGEAEVISKNGVVKALQSFSDDELGGILRQGAGSKYGELKKLNREQKELWAIGYLSDFQPVRDCSPPVPVPTTNPEQPSRDAGSAPTQENMTMANTDTTTASAKKKKKKAAKTAAPEPVKRGRGRPKGSTKKPDEKSKKQHVRKTTAGLKAANGDNTKALGREGTPARFIREAYLAGKSTDVIFDAVKKRFPENRIEGKSYVSWYYHDMRRKGLIE